MALSAQTQNRPRAREAGVTVGVLPDRPTQRDHRCRRRARRPHNPHSRRQRSHRRHRNPPARRKPLSRESARRSLRRQRLWQTRRLDSSQRAGRNRNTDPADFDSERPARRRLPDRLHARAARQRRRPVNQSRSSPRRTTVISTTFAGATSRATMSSRRSKARKAAQSQKARSARAPEQSPLASKAASAPRRANCQPGLGGFTVGVLVQSNFGGVLTINGAPVGRELGRYYLKDELAEPGEGSPAKPARRLDNHRDRDRRSARRPKPQPPRGPGDDGPGQDRRRGQQWQWRLRHRFLNRSRRSRQTSQPKRAKRASRQSKHLQTTLISPLFLAVIEATEEAIYNSLFRATTTTGKGRTVEALPLDRTLEILRKHGLTTPVR